MPQRADERAAVGGDGVEQGAGAPRIPFKAGRKNFVNNPPGNFRRIAGL
jgi:hypothetical protein